MASNQGDPLEFKNNFQLMHNYRKTWPKLSFSIPHEKLKAHLICKNDFVAKNYTGFQIGNVGSFML